MTTLRSFIGCALSSEVLEGLRGAQRQLYRLARARKTSVNNLEKSALILPLVDLGEVTLPALEAVEVALDRVSQRHTPFSLRVGGISAFPSEETPEIIWARLWDEGARLTSLQEALSAQLERYGFPLLPGRFIPHIPLAGAPSGFGPLEVEGIGEALGRQRIDHIALFVPSLSRRGPRFKPGLIRALAESLPDDSGVSDEALFAELDARLAMTNTHTQGARPA